MGKAKFPEKNQTETMERNVQPETLPQARILRTAKTYSSDPIVFYRSSRPVQISSIPRLSAMVTA